MANASFSQVMGSIQGAFDSVLQPKGFQAHEYTYNRGMEDGLIQVVDIQLYPSKLPYPGWEKYRARFTINLGVYVPEVGEHYSATLAQTPWVKESGLVVAPLEPWVLDIQCALRERIGHVSEDAKDIWWPLREDEMIIEDALYYLQTYGIPFVEHWSSRDRILENWDENTARGMNLAPNVVKAIILSERGDMESARVLLAEHVHELDSPDSEHFFRRLAKRLGIWRLDG
ncbi:MAG: DUF4304 domain-containing protein [Limnochordia bacterium]|jgi:hypothetical protein